ncbi:valine--tRNA ligase [Proteiniphilum sp. UBA7639]|jgi:valyl-tRNA synthetase|uniref:valine--tRNA ligase n=1 Tax=Proteiniphilum sp. UBA7639 TaxID=1947289 RepID=UPI00257D1F17|nr:valine--tRNA ligase [Proteiniphilum sp. UBA7639]
MEIASKYNPAEVEEKWYKYWMDNKLFHSEPDHREPFTIVIPPPNVTGVLHMGHMLNNTIQDVLVRRARMQGKNACWVPGTDHASIATEAKVVNRLASRGVKKTDLGRKEFLKHAWEWTHEHGGIILEQLKKLGASCDWDRTAFTMDDVRSESVLRVFCDLYEKGLIYRGVRMVNWDPKALTALSDEEVIHREVSGKLYYLRYKIDGDPDGAYAVVATTRPETIMGDTAMCINPNDPKNAYLKGKKVIVPLVNRVIPVIEDDYVDVEFGTGCLKVTPAHDINDYVLGEKYNLPAIDIFNHDGTLNENGMQYEGMDRFKVRKQIEKDLEKAGLLDKTEPYTNKVGFSERTDEIIEPKLSMQWFLKMGPLVKPAADAVENDTIRFYPEKYKNTFRHWMENIKDWCISRQLWWGHQIPAYFLPKGGYVVAMSKEEALEKARQQVDYDITIDDLKQDEDVLDTWFSSWLWPISVFDGINRPGNKDISYYYPTSDLVTGPDIIFFWVARMIMSGYEYRQEPCFRNVYFTGIVRDKQGRKMSKQLGNSPDPVELMDKYGADGVRMGMLLSSAAGNDLLFDETLCEQGRNFNNKIWNAFRLVKGWEIDKNITQPESSKIAVEWFQVKLSETISEIDDLFSKYRLSEALMLLYKLFWDEFSGWYLEIIKPAYQQPLDADTYRATLKYFDALLRLLHPFMPFITEELWQALYTRETGESIMTALQPKEKTIDKTLIDGFEEMKQVVAGVRTIRLEKSIPNRDELQLQVIGSHNSKYNSIILKMCNLSSISAAIEKQPGDSGFLVGTTEYSVPLADKMDVEAELSKMKAELAYTEGFLQSVLKKLGNERFVLNAKPEIVENERRKQADAESKIALLKENIEALSTE